jgi:hypothetical protein
MAEKIDLSKKFFTINRLQLTSKDRSINIKCHFHQPK